MKTYRIQKGSGCILEVCIFDNGTVAESWQTDIAKTSIYPSIEAFNKAMEYRREHDTYNILEET